MSICEHFDSSVDAGSRYYYQWSPYHNWIASRVYDVNKTIKHLNEDPNRNQLWDWVRRPIINSSCIGESQGKKLDECKFNGYLRQLLSLNIFESEILIADWRGQILPQLENDDSKSSKRKVVSVMMSYAIHVK